MYDALKRIRHYDHGAAALAYEYLGEDIAYTSNLSTREQIEANPIETSTICLMLTSLSCCLLIAVRFLMTSDDVIHSWWVPELAVKQDTIPGFINEIGAN